MVYWEWQANDVEMNINREVVFVKSKTEKNLEFDNSPGSIEMERF